MVFLRFRIRNEFGVKMFSFVKYCRAFPRVFSASVELVVMLRITLTHVEKTTTIFDFNVAARGKQIVFVPVSDADGT